MGLPLKDQEIEYRRRNAISRPIDRLRATFIETNTHPPIPILRRQQSVPDEETIRWYNNQTRSPREDN